MLRVLQAALLRQQLIAASCDVLRLLQQTAAGLESLTTTDPDIGKDSCLEADDYATHEGFVDGERYIVDETFVGH